MKVTMTKHEYEFMTGQWEGPKDAVYTRVVVFCQSRGWIRGFSDHYEPIPTEEGTAAIETYKKMQNNP